MAASPPPDPAQGARLRFALRWLVVVTLAVAAYEGAMFALTGTTALLAAALVAVVLAGCMAGALHLLRRGRTEASVLLIAVAVYLAAAAYSVALPGSVLSLSLLPIVVVALGLPYLDRAALRRLVVLAWAGGMALLAYNVFSTPSPALPSKEFRVLAYAAVAGLVMVTLAHSSARLHETLRQTRIAHDALRALDAQKAQFLSATAHELRTPMTPVLAQLHLLREGSYGALNDRQRKAVDVLDRNMLRLNDLVEDVLDVARLQAGRLRLAVQPVALRPALGDTAESFRAAADRAGVALEVDVPEGLVVLADPRRLAQVMDNLLSNALKFTPAGGRVLVHAEAADGGAVIRVADTGAGMAARDLPLLFQPFSRLGSAEGKPGAGLGLYVVRGIVEAHGGRITGESGGPGRGSTFVLHLPLAAPGAGVPPPAVLASAAAVVTSPAGAGTPRGRA